MININTFVVIIHFSSKNIYTIPKKNDMIRKESSSLIYKQTILTKTKYINEKKDMYAIVKIEQFLKDKNIIYCDVCNYLGYIDDINLENNLMEHICSSHWINTKNLNNQFIKLHNIDLTPNRFFDNNEIYSIDPLNCLDIDDALHYNFNIDTKEHEIGIHIADVSSYIEENTILDLELSNRVETIYCYKSKQIDMIPKELSIEHISLLEGKEKRAFSIIFKLDENYNIINVDYKKTLIIVKKNLTYEKAQEMIFDNFVIKNLYFIGQKLKEKITNEFIEDKPYDTHQMVAIYMIYANKYVSEKIKSFSPDKVLLRTHTNNTNITNKNKSINNLLEYKNKLANVENANYQIGCNNSFHFGLGLNNYTHFTSPIRRYADIIVHRQLWNTINNIQLKYIEKNIIEHINFCKKIYKYAERLMHINEISKNIIDYCETNAFITNFNENTKMIRLYIPKYDFDYDINIIHEKLQHIYNIEITENELTMTNLHNNEINKYYLFQEIQIKIVPIKDPFIKLLFEILIN